MSRGGAALSVDACIGLPPVTCGTPAAPDVYQSDITFSGNPSNAAVAANGRSKGLTAVLGDQAYGLSTLTFLVLYAGLAQAWNLASGFGGQASLGHAAFLGAGAYATSIAILHAGLPAAAALVWQRSAGPRWPRWPP